LQLCCFQIRNIHVRSAGGVSMWHRCGVPQQRRESREVYMDRYARACAVYMYKRGVWRSHDPFCAAQTPVRRDAAPPRAYFQCVWEADIIYFRWVLSTCTKNAARRSFRHSGVSPRRSWGMPNPVTLLRRIYGCRIC